MNRTIIASFMCMALAVATLGCDPMVLDEGEPTNVNIAGTWSYTDTGGGRSTWVLTQADDDLVDGTGTASETITGYVREDNVQLTVIYSSNLTASVSGTVADGVISGTFTNSISVRGAWVAYAMDQAVP